MRYPAVILLLTLSLTACGSSPKTHFYTLTPVPADGAVQRAGKVAPIEVGHVDLPSALDRLSFVTRGAGERVDVSDQDRWAAPLDELTRRALTSDLRERMPTDTVLAPGDAAPPGTRTLALNVQQFMADEAGHVVLDADWSVQTSGKSPVVRHEAIQTTMNGQGGESVANAMSRALGQLADRIAATL